MNYELAKQLKEAGYPQKSFTDEEKARVNEVLHEIVGALHDGAFDTQNCNYLHQMIEEKLV